MDDGCILRILDQIGLQRYLYFTGRLYFIAVFIVKSDIYRFYSLDLVIQSAVYFIFHFILFFLYGRNGYGNTKHIGHVTGYKDYAAEGPRGQLGQE